MCYYEYYRDIERKIKVRSCDCRRFRVGLALIHYYYRFKASSYHHLIISIDLYL